LKWGTYVNLHVKHEEMMKKKRAKNEANNPKS